MDQLDEVRQKLENERQGLIDRLKEIEDNLAAIEKVYGLIRPRNTVLQVDDGVMFLTSSVVKVESSSNRLADLSFKDAVLQLLKENPSKHWSPKDLAAKLLTEGFRTKSKNFPNLTRTVLADMRKKGELAAIRVGGGYLYGYKEAGPASESHSDTGPQSTGGVDELV